MDFLSQTAFTLWGAGVTWAEVFGDVTGGLCVWLVTRQHIANWPIGLANNAFWCILFWNSKLYADSVLQVFFFSLGAYGWWTWVYGGNTGRDSLPVRQAARVERIRLGVVIVIVTVALGFFLDNGTDSPAPYWDASVLTLSLAALYWQTQKAIESWWLWITVDVISVPLYISRSLYPTAALYFIFGLMCVIGLRNWRRDLRSQQLSAA